MAPIAATRQFLIRDDDFHTRDSPDPLPPAAPAELAVANNGRYLLSQKWAHVCRRRVAEIAWLMENETYSG